MTLQVTAGSKIFMGTTAIKADATAYAADTWVQIKEVTDMGDFGDSAQEIKTETIEDSRVRKYAGIRDGGDINLVVAFDPAETGQSAVRAVAGINVEHNFKITANDAPSGGGTPTTWYFRGIVLSQTVKMGQGNNVVMQTFKIAVNSDTIMVPAAA